MSYGGSYDISNVYIVWFGCFEKNTVQASRECRDYPLALWIDRVTPHTFFLAAVMVQDLSQGRLHWSKQRYISQCPCQLFFRFFQRSSLDRWLRTPAMCQTNSGTRMRGLTGHPTKHATICPLSLPHNSNVSSEIARRRGQRRYTGDIALS